MRRFVRGLPETACGGGSTLAATENIRRELPALLRRLSVRRLVDAPCGDVNWIRLMDLGGIEYVGCDNDQEHIALARSRMPDAEILQKDILAEEIPHGDVLLCRDFLQHLPTAEAMAFLRRFITSGIPWLIATSHRNADNRDIRSIGDFRPLNLRVSPFNFPPPFALIEDGGRDLALWNRAVLEGVLP